MARLSDAIQKDPSPKTVQQLDNPAPTASSPPAVHPIPDLSPFQISTMPLLSAADSLRQFYRFGNPQYRSYPLTPLANQ